MTALTQLTTSPPTRRPKYAAVTCSRVRSVAGPSSDDPALEHADDAVGDVERAREVLLDERPPSCRPRRCGASERRRRRRRPARGRARPRRAAPARGWSSARGRSRWPAARPRRAATRPLAERPRAAGTPRAPRRSSTARAAPCSRRDQRFSSTVRLGNSRRPSGTSAMPRRTRWWAGTPATSVAVEADRSRCAPCCARRSPAAASSSPRRWRRRWPPSRPESTCERELVERPGSQP